MLEQARKVIANALAANLRPAVMCSFGKDSMLLLHLVRERVEDVPVIWLGQETTPNQFAFISRMLIEWDLTLFKIAPAHQYVVQAPNGDHSLIREYVLNGEPYPVVSDMVYSNKRCLLKINPMRSKNVEMPFDCVFTGWKEADRHPIFAASPIPFPPDGVEISGAKWYAPLRGLTDDDVWQATRNVSIPYNEAKYDERREAADPDNVVACAHCVVQKERVFCHDVGREIDPVEWDHDWTREYFLRKFFGL